MKARYCTLGIALLAVLFFIGMIGCGGVIPPAKYTGGGTVDSAKYKCADGEKANFGFVANNCGEEIKGHITYHDKFYPLYGLHCPGDTDFEKANKQGVKLMGEIMGECDGNSIKFSYVSQNPFCPGEGIGTAWVEDNGEGANAEDDDLFCIYIKSGPFDDYRNCGKKKYGEYQGRVVQGNIQYHPCDGSDGGELIW